MKHLWKGEVNGKIFEAMVSERVAKSVRLAREFQKKEGDPLNDLSTRSGIAEPTRDITFRFVRPGEDEYQKIDTKK